MAKEKEIPLPQYGIYAWGLQEHTKMKHELLRCYIAPWFTILSKYHDVYYIDGFSGCGIYIDESNVIYPGSPIISAQAWETNGNKSNSMKMYVIDNNKRCIGNLLKVFKYYNVQHVNPIVLCGNFDDELSKLIDAFDKSNTLLEPAFFFIDPHGLNFKFSTLTRILANRKVELLINFMYDGVSRCIGANNETLLNEFMGSDGWKRSIGLTGFEKEDLVISTFRNNLKKHASFVWPYKVHSSVANRTLYYLVHVSNHIKAAKTLRGCFTAVNHGRIEYLGRVKDQLRIFDLDNFKEEELKDFLIDTFKSKTISYDDLFGCILDMTPFDEPIYRTTLKNMEKSGLVTIMRITSDPKRKGLSGLDRITFI